MCSVGGTDFEFEREEIEEEKKLWDEMRAGSIYKTESNKIEKCPRCEEEMKEATKRLWELLSNSKHLICDNCGYEIIRIG